MRKKTAVMFIPVVLMFLCCSAAAQDFPKYEFSGGYFYSRMGGANWNGWHLEGAKNLGPVLGIVVDVGRPHGTQSDIFPDGSSYELKRKMYTIMAGPRGTFRGPYKMIPYGHILLGAAHESFTFTQSFGEISEVTEDSGTHFAMGAGGGIDYTLKGPLSLRGQLDYMGFRDSGFWVKGVRLSVGLAIRLGTGQ